MGINIREVLGDEADSLLGHECKTIERDQLTLPGPTSSTASSSKVTGRSPVLRNLQQMFDHGRLGGTGYLSILPVDQGIEHSAAASFSKNPAYFDPQNLAELALAADCSAFAIDPRRARHHRPPLRPQDPAHRQAQPQRAPHLSEPRATRCRSPRSARPSTSAPSASGRRSTSAPRRAPARSGR